MYTKNNIFIVFNNKAFICKLQMILLILKIRTTLVNLMLVYTVRQGFGSARIRMFCPVWIRSRVMQKISFLLFRLQESGLGSQDILSEKPWKLKKKKYAGIIFTSGEKGNICFFVLFIRFRQFRAEKNFINSFWFFYVVQNHLKRKKNNKNHFFPLPPIPQGSGSGSAKNADPKHCLTFNISKHYR